MLLNGLSTLFGFWKRQKTPAIPVSKPAASGGSPAGKTARKSSKLKAAALTSSAQAFPSLGEKELLTLYQHALVKALKPKTVLYRAQDIGDYFYLVIKGQIQLERSAPPGGEAIREILQKGDWVADANLARPVPRNSTATALTSTTVMMINRAVLMRLDDRLRVALFSKIHSVNTRKIHHLNSANERFQHMNSRLISGLVSASHKYDPDVAGSELIQSIIQKIPRLPVSTGALVSKLMDQRSSTREIVELVKMDPSLTGEVLKTINSSRFSFQQKIADVNHAVVLLGYDGVYQMVMAAGIRKSLPDTEVFQEMYEHALAISNIAFAISQESRAGQPSELATIGLLHQVGLTVIELLKEQNPKMIPLIAYLENADMGAALLRAWGIPEVVSKSVEFQRYPEFAPPAQVDREVLEPVAILYLSQITYALLKGETLESLPTLFLDDYLQVLNWHEVPLEETVNNTLAPNLRKRRKGLPNTLAEHL